MLQAWNGKALLSLIWPLVIEQVLQVTMGAADTIMISLVGEHAVSGVNVVDNINNLLIIAFGAMCQGGAVVVSQYIGRKDTANAGTAAKQLIYIVSLIAVGMTLFALVFRRPLISVIYGSMESNVMDAALIYLFLTCLSFPALGIYNANAALFRAVGNSRITMLIALMVNVINVGGNAFFILVCGMGVWGVGLSTLLCRAAAAVVTTVLLFKGHGRPLSIAGLFGSRAKPIRLSRSMIRNILNVGIPSGLESSMFQVGRLLTQRILPVFGTAAQAGNAIASVINSFSFMPGMAFGMTLVTVVGQCVGAGDYFAAKKLTARIMKLCYVVLIVMSGSILLFLEPLIGLFNLSPQAAAYAREFLEIHCISMMIGWPISFALPNALRAAGDAKYVMWVATISMWTVRVSLAYVLSYAAGLGPIGVWLAMGADFISRGSFYTYRWLRGKWQSKKVITA
jgi:putative MATE family efflux protein